MTSVPHLFCTLHNHNCTHIAATHSTFLSEYPGITFHRAGLWCYYTPLFAVYVLTPVGWLYVVPSALNGVVNEWKEKMKSPLNDTFVPFLYKSMHMSIKWRRNCDFFFFLCLFVHLFVFRKKDVSLKKHQHYPFQLQQILSIMIN